MPDVFAARIAQAVLDVGTNRLPGRIAAKIDDVSAEAKPLLRIEQLGEQEFQPAFAQDFHADTENVKRDRADVVVATAHEVDAIENVVGRLEQVAEKVVVRRCRDVFHSCSRHRYSPDRPAARQRRKSNEFDTTETELIAIAAPAITGLSIPNAASGIPRTL